MTPDFSRIRTIMQRARGVLTAPVRPDMFIPPPRVLKAALYIAAAAFVYKAVPGDYYSRTVPAQIHRGYEGFSVETTVPGAQGNVWRAFDGSLSGECFHSEKGATAGSVTMTFPRAFVASRLRIATQGGFLSRAPRDFYIEGQAEDGSWKKLGDFSGAGAYAPSAFNDFKLNSERPYRTYRLVITANGGDDYLTFSELSLEEIHGAGLRRLGLTLFFWACLTLLFSRPLEARLWPSEGPGTVAQAAALALLPFTLFLLLPAQIYLGNAMEFSGTLIALLPRLAAVSLAAYGLMLGAFFLIPVSGKSRSRFLSLAVAAGLLVWLQASVWPWAGGQLAGSVVHFPASTETEMLQAALWITVLAFAWLAPRLTGRFAALIAAAVLGAQALAVARAMPDLSRLEANKSLYSNPENLLRFSADKPNGVLVVIDMFQADLFQEILNSGGGAYTAELDGFTYFPDTTSAFPLTSASMPHLLTGSRFENKTRLADFRRDAFRKNSLPLSASRAGFSVALRSWAAPASFYIDRDIVPDAEGPGRMRLMRSLALLLDMSVFEAVPDPVRPWVYGRGLWLSLRALTREESTKAGDKRLAMTMERGAFAEPGPGAFKLLHLAGNHIPLDTDENLKPVPMEFNRENAIRQGKGALLLLGKILAGMKRAGVYDNSFIIVAADHGSGLGIMPGRGRKPLTYWQARGVPLLLAKAAGAKGKLRNSSAQAELGDISFTLAHALGWAGQYEGMDLFAPTVRAGRKRLFVNSNSQREEKFDYFREYEVSGHAWDGASWRETGR